MYAPLALTFVYRNRLFIRRLTRYFLRAPVVPIQVNATTSSKATSHTGAISGGIAGGVATLILMVGTIAFVQRRRRLDHIQNSAGSSFTGTTDSEALPQTTVMPFNLTPDGWAPLEVGSQVRTTNDGPLTFEPLPPLPAHCAAPVPVGLSGKELALLRSATVLSPPTPPRTSSSGFQPNYPPAVDATEGITLTPTPEAQRPPWHPWQMAVESLQREVQELRAERFEGPPSYGQLEGGGV